MSLIDCQETVTTTITSAPLSLGAVNAFTPEIELKDVKDLKVFVVPVDVVNPRRMDRAGTWEEQPIIQIGIARRVQNGSVTIQDILTVANTIREHFKNLFEIVGTSTYFIMDVTFTPFYVYEELDEDTIVLSIIQITFKEFTK